MYKLINISSDNSKFKLGASVLDNNTYDNIFLVINDSELLEVWDEPTYLISTFYPYLKDGNISDEMMDDVECTFTEKEKEELLMIFEEAIKMGIFDNVKRSEEL